MIKYLMILKVSVGFVAIKFLQTGPVCLYFYFIFRKRLLFVFDVLGVLRFSFFMLKIIKFVFGWNLNLAFPI